VDEALTLSDEVVVLGGGAILDRFDVKLPHPRSRLDSQFGKLRNRLLDQLGVPAV
jgi:sulfonate transport system ATP-binding protein